MTENKRKKGLEPWLISENDFSLKEEIDSLREAYKLSCEHNEVTEDNIEYFRTYMFLAISVLNKRIQPLERFIAMQISKSGKNID